MSRFITNLSIDFYLDNQVIQNMSSGYSGLKRSHISGNKTWQGESVA